MDGYDSETGEVLITTYPAAIAKAIVAVMAEVKMIGVDEKNPHGGYPYVSVDKFYDIIGRKMAAHGLALMIDETAADVREGSSGKPWLFARYSMAFVHESGATSPSVRRSIALPISGPQTFGAAQSYIEKQFLRQVFKVPTGEKDADETDNSEKASPAPASRRPSPRAESARQSPDAGAYVNKRGEEISKQEAWNRYTTFRDAVKATTSDYELDALFASTDWQDLQTELLALGEGKRIDTIIKMRNEKAGTFDA